MQEPVIIKENIIAAALERYRAQKKLEEWAQKGMITPFMRQRQLAVNEADRKISDEAAKLAAFLDEQLT